MSTLVGTTGEVAKKQQNSTFQYYYRGDVYLNSQDPIAKTSNITINWVMYCKSSGTSKWSGVATSNAPYGSITGNANSQGGVRLATGNPITSYTTTTNELMLATYTGDFAHDANGNLSIRVSFGWNTGSGTTANYRPATFNSVITTSGIPQIINSMKIMTAAGWKGDATYIMTSEGWKEAIGIYIKTPDGWQHS